MSGLIVIWKSTMLNSQKTPILVPFSLFFIIFFRYILIKLYCLDEINTYRTFSGTTQFDFTPQSTSCTGGTISGIYIPAAGDNSESTTFILTIRELKTCNGFEDISDEQAEIIIQALSQFSALCYQVLVDDRPSKI
jgi:hypothetical protein